LSGVGAAVIGDGLVYSAILFLLFSSSRICDANRGGGIEIKKGPRPSPSRPAPVPRLQTTSSI